MRWVRAVISIIGMGGVTIGFFLKMVSPEAYLGLVTLAITWWYRSRDSEKEKENKK